MDLNDYFEPVSLTHPSHRNVRAADEFARRLTVHVPDRPIEEIGQYDVAILGVPEDRNSDNKGAAEAPATIRQKLYSLSQLRSPLKIIDLGDMHAGTTPTDTLYGLRDIIFHLLEHDVIAVVMGGTQEITLTCHEAAQRYKGRASVVNVDARLDLAKDREELRADTWLEELLENGTPVTCLGYQEYLVSHHDIQRLISRGHILHRLGKVRDDLPDHEPCFRDAVIHSFDLSAVRMSDAPGTLDPSPNGFTGTEICQMSLYAGLSNHVGVYLLTETNPRLDQRDQTSHLAAQMIWFFLSGLARRTREIPNTDDENFVQFILDLPDTDEKIIFLKSNLTDRWWFLSPLPDKHTGKKEWIPCSYHDYQRAAHQEIPERWFSLLQK